MNNKFCFITYLDVLDHVKNAAKDNHFIVSEVTPVSDGLESCQVWVVDEGSSRTTLTRAFYLGRRIKNIEYYREKFRL